MCPSWLSIYVCTCHVVCAHSLTLPAPSVENHYFGEDEEAQQQQEEEQQRRQQQEDERQRMEEDEGDEGDHRFRDDIGNEDNKEAALADANN